MCCSSVFVCLFLCLCFSSPLIHLLCCSFHQLCPTKPLVTPVNHLSCPIQSHHITSRSRFLLLSLCQNSLWHSPLCLFFFSSPHISPSSPLLPTAKLTATCTPYNWQICPLLQPLTGWLSIFTNQAWRKWVTWRATPSAGRPPWRSPRTPSATCRSSSSTSASSSSASCSSTLSSYWCERGAGWGPLISQWGIRISRTVKGVGQLKWRVGKGAGVGWWWRWWW